jgi:hypothetical protein
LKPCLSEHIGRDELILFQSGWQIRYAIEHALKMICFLFGRAKFLIVYELIEFKEELILIDTIKSAILTLLS